MIVSREDLVDVLRRDEECLVLTKERCFRLTAVATAVLDLLVKPLPDEELTRQLEAEFGAAPPGRLGEILAELESQGLVLREDA